MHSPLRKIRMGICASRCTRGDAVGLPKCTLVFQIRDGHVKYSERRVKTLAWVGNEGRISLINTASVGDLAIISVWMFGAVLRIFNVVGVVHRNANDLIVSVRRILYYSFYRKRNKMWLLRMDFCTTDGSWIVWISSASAESQQITLPDGCTFINIYIFKSKKSGKVLYSNKEGSWICLGFHITIWLTFSWPAGWWMASLIWILC